ncbi:MAG: BrnT family toxin [Acidobacteriota bacterium]
MEFEWDPKKAASNLRKHRVSFEEAASVFNDIHAAVYEDPDHSKAEKRYLTVGSSAQGRLLIVAYAHRGERIRIINARKVTRRERELYEEEDR